MKKPLVELSDCILCEVCVEVCPVVFSLNAAGFILVVNVTGYTEIEVEEAIKNCPADCIYWVDD